MAQITRREFVGGAMAVSGLALSLELPAQETARQAAPGAAQPTPAPGIAEAVDEVKRLLDAGRITQAVDRRVASMNSEACVWMTHGIIVAAQSCVFRDLERHGMGWGAPMDYPAGIERDVVLKNGETVRIRTGESGPDAL